MRLLRTAATLALALAASVTAPAAQAAEFCITNGAQAAHGCGYPTMEACQAASSGIGGMCSERGGSGSTSVNDAFAQQKPARSVRAKKEAVH
jgi:hypothetical protein